jgi:hypothetical protein
VSSAGAGEDLPGLFKQDAAGFGQFDAPFRPPEERCLELSLELLNLVGERRLGDAQLGGGLAEMERFTEGNEVAQVSEFHETQPGALIVRIY